MGRHAFTAPQEAEHGSGARVGPALVLLAGARPSGGTLVQGPEVLARVPGAGVCDLAALATAASRRHATRAGVLGRQSVGCARPASRRGSPPCRRGPIHVLPSARLPPPLASTTL